MEQLAAGKSKFQTWERGHAVLSTFPVVFTFVSVALTGLLGSEGNHDSTIICTLKKIIEPITMLFKNHYYVVMELNAVFM